MKDTIPSFLKWKPIQRPIKWVKGLVTKFLFILVRLPFFCSAWAYISLYFLVEGNLLLGQISFTDKIIVSCQKVFLVHPLVLLPFPFVTSLFLVSGGEGGERLNNFFLSTKIDKFLQIFINTDKIWRIYRCLWSHVYYFPIIIDDLLILTGKCWSPIRLYIS